MSAPPDPTPVSKPKKEKPKLSFFQLIKAMWGPYLDLLPFLKPYKWRFIFGLLCGAGAGGASAALIFVTQHVTSVVFPSGGSAAKPSIMGFLNSGGGDKAVEVAGEAVKAVPIESVIWTCALIPAAIILRGFLSFLNSYNVSWVSLRLLTDLRNALFRALMSQSITFYNKAQAGQLISRVINDSRMAQAALTQVSSDLVTQPATIIGALAALLYMDPKFTFVSLVLFPVCLVPVIVFGKRVRRGGADEEAGAGNMMTILHEAFGGIRVVKALSREEDEINDFREASNEQFKTSVRVRKAIELVAPSIESISAIGVGLAMVYVWAAGISADRFLSLMMGLFMLYDPAKKLSRIQMMIQKALGATERIFKLMRTESNVKDAPDATVLPPAKGAIEFCDVGFSYLPGRVAVKGINLSITPGTTCALVGTSGSGKSTLLSLLLRFYDPQEGCIRIDSHDIRGVTQASLRQQIAIVSQDTFLFHTTILENIRYGRLDATDEEVYAAAEQAFAHDFILEQPNGYETVIGDKGCNLSGGQQQRLAIARALLRNAPILLLDEATSALDSESEQQIQLALERLSQGRTVIAIAHRLSTILKADRIVAMQNGEIMEVGTHAELFEKNGHYRRLYDLQFNRKDGADAEGQPLPAEALPAMPH